MGTEKPKIYCWVNSGHGSEFQMVMAMAEDGHVLASHCSSSEYWAKHDIGLTGTWKHDLYAKHYPDGYELVWVEDARPGRTPGLDEAYAKNQAMTPPKGAVAAPSESDGTEGK
jgi:hypothetical protein